jgi:hypothetical protein
MRYPLPFYSVRKISEMDIDEFMTCGFDSDVSTGDEEDTVNDEDTKKPEPQLANR